MPKILIKEFDKTTAGTPGRYGNYSVLLAGFRANPYSEDDEVQPDSNGVYEFNSSANFTATIGEVASDVHFGNAMARELLDLGYTVLYKPFEKISDMANADFWSIFRDKANYDFRFISHGLVSSYVDTEAKNDIDAKRTAANTKYEAVATDVKKFAEILGQKDKDDTAKEEDYNALLTEGYNGFWTVNTNGEIEHPTYSKAKESYTTGSDGQIPALVDAASIRDGVYAECDSEEYALSINEVTSDNFQAINKLIAELAYYDKDSKEEVPGRGDCIALIEADEADYTGQTKPEVAIIESISGMDIGAKGPYCAMTVPSVYYYKGKNDDGSKKLMKMPGAFHYLACFMTSLKNGFAEWYAAAGYTRGVSSYTIDHTSVKLGEIAINALEPRNRTADLNKTQPKFACNVIANFRGSYYLWGNRTAYQLKDEKATPGDLTAWDFLNIRQLCTTIKKQIYVACRQFTFDPNSDTLWFNFVNAIAPTLDAMKADQGVRDYKIIKVANDKKAVLQAKVRIIPIEAVEDFDIDVYLEDSFGEVSVATN